MKGKVVVITGASSGIGEATALLLGRKGAQIVLAARRVDRLRRIEEQVQKNGGQALVLGTDISQRSSVELMIQMTLARFGKISALVNNAGLGWIGRFQDLPEEELERMFKVNVFGSYWATQAALPYLMREKGVVVNVASIAGLVPSAYSAAYSATKAAQIHIGNSLTLELVGSGVKVVNVCPGVTRTEFFKSMQSPIGNQLFSGQRADSAEKVAKKIVRAISHPRRYVILNWTGWFGWWVFKAWPWLFDRAARVYFAKRKKQVLEDKGPPGHLPPPENLPPPG